MVMTGCSVIFRAFIPIDPAAPYLIISSHGLHSHPPPPPSQPPNDILQELQVTLDGLDRAPTTLSISPLCINDTLTNLL
jgi:hypothetical protein